MYIDLKGVIKDNLTKVTHIVDLCPIYDQIHRIIGVNVDNFINMLPSILVKKLSEKFGCSVELRDTVLSYEWELEFCKIDLSIYTVTEIKNHIYLMLEEIIEECVKAWKKDPYYNSQIEILELEAKKNKIEKQIQELKDKQNRV